MNGRMKSLSLVVLFVSLSSATADEGVSTWQTTASREGTSLAEQRQDVIQAQQIIKECEHLVESMKEFEQQPYAKKGGDWQTFVQKHQPTIRRLIREGRQLKQTDLKTAGQLPEVANVVMIALGYKGNNAFETVLRIYEQDRDKAELHVHELECRLPRKWSNRSGSQTVVAEFVSLGSNKVVLRRLDNGRQVTVVIDKLSDVDRHFLNRIAQGGRFDDRQMLKEIGIERRSISGGAE